MHNLLIMILAIMKVMDKPREIAIRYSADKIAGLAMMDYRLRTKSRMNKIQN